MVGMQSVQCGADCPLCAGPGGAQIWSDEAWRVVRVADDDFPAFYRVIAKPHVVEFTDLPLPEQQRCMALVCSVERVLRKQLAPTKINLASLGNMTPHLHWHVIARFDWDSHYPQPVWGTAQRSVEPSALALLPMPLARLDEAVHLGLHSPYT